MGVDRRLPRRELRADAAGGRRLPERPSSRRSRRSRPGRSARSAPASWPIASDARRSPIAAMARERQLRGDRRLCSAATRCWLVALCLVWGVSIVADSAQFSASIAELSDRAWVGTMLTLQTALGFTLTLRDHSPDAVPHRRVGLALRVRAAGDRSRLRRLRDGAAARPSAVGGARRRAALTGIPDDRIWRRREGRRRIGVRWPCRD